MLTVCAYLSWSAGHVGRAAEWGLKALLADEECTLAALVVTACEHGMLPDWALWTTTVLLQFFLSNFCTIFPQYGLPVSSRNCTI